MDYCIKCWKKVDLKVFPDGFVECPDCGRIEIPSHMWCARCGFVCPHVEAGGVHSCPNCGDPKNAGDGKCTYEFNQGCSTCGLPGHMPKPGFMEPVVHGHPRAALGLSPVIPIDASGVAEIMDE
jgi:DNA-directed RNA polymerase subunit RPC12/RpoP